MKTMKIEQAKYEDGTTGIITHITFGKTVLRTVWPTGCPESNCKALFRHARLIDKLNRALRPLQNTTQYAPVRYAPSYLKKALKQGIIQR